MITDFRLKVFHSVASTLSFTKAAIELNISQPAVTKHIKELEKCFGTSLFMRQGNRITPTSTALNILPTVEKILASYNSLNEQTDAQTNQFRGVLRMGASTTVEQYILPEILAEFKKKYPQIEITLISGNTEHISNLLINSSIDFAIVEGGITYRSLHYEHFASDEIVLVTSHGKRNRISTEDICNIPIVLRENGSGTLDVTETSLAKVGIHRNNLNVIMQIGSSEGIIRYLRNSNSYAFISIAAVDEYVKNGILKIVKINEFNILRSLRFTSLHGNYNRLVELFKSYCISYK